MSGGATVTPWSESAKQAVRTLAPITVAGALLGVLVGGIGGRLAMRLLAAVNPDATGRTSDDGFTIGQFTMSETGGLLLTGWLLGMIGAAFYAVLRGLMIGPRWFQVLSISVGPAVVVGAIIVHVDGVDFALLEPLWLAVGLFIAIPLVYSALLTLLAEHWIGSDGWFARAPLPWVSATLCCGFLCSRRSSPRSWYGSAPRWCDGMPPKGDEYPRRWSPGWRAGCSSSSSASLSPI